MDIRKRKIIHKKQSMGATIWRGYKKNPGAMIGLVLILIIIFLALTASFFFDYKDDVIKQNIPHRLKSPGSEYPLGTDQYGRNILARLIYGSRFSLSVGIIAVAIALLVGGTIGSIAGYYGGIIENILMRTCDVFASIPSMLLAIAIASAFGQNIFVLMIAVGVVSVPAFARVMRASVMTVRDQEFIEAAEAAGARDYQIIISHILPNAMAPVLVQSTLRVASAIVTASALSYLGLGIPAPAPEWGGMLSEGRSLIRDYSYMTLFPGLAIMITVLSINLIGDGLRDAMDPKLKR